MKVTSVTNALSGLARRHFNLRKKFMKTPRTVAADRVTLRPPRLRLTGYKGKP